MITATISGLLTPELLQQVQGAYIYILSAGDDVMYIGQTKDFQRGFWDFYNTTILTVFKVNDQQDVFSWKVELLTLDDCLPFLGDTKFSLGAARRKLMQIKHPCLSEVNAKGAAALPVRYKHLSLQLIKERRKSESEVSDASNPMDEHEKYWLYAYNKQSRKRSVNALLIGKWLVFINKDQVNDAWFTIRKATEDGLLGDRSKCATAKENRNARNSDKKVICVYTNDYQDKQDVLRVLNALRELGFTQGMAYKTNSATLSGQYAWNSSGRVSLYYARPGEIDLG